jgi:hypothetical protein
MRDRKEDAMVKRLFDDCRLCENRGLICDDDEDCAGPSCNAWYSLCLEQPLEAE